jgi:hypothetical protein
VAEEVWPTNRPEALFDVGHCCNYAQHNSSLLLRTVFLSGESTLFVEGKVAKQDALRPQRKTVRQAANDRVPAVRLDIEQAKDSEAANDNPMLDGLPACLPVTDEEVRLLHRYLGAQILGLFA